MGNRSVPRTFVVASGDQVADVRIPQTTTAPALDGIREPAAYTLPALAISNLGEGSLPTNDDDFSANWTATWDTTNLYVHVAVTDNIRMVNSTNWYSDDNVEIFLNGNGARPATYGATDFHFMIRPGGTIEQWRNFAVRPVPAGVEATIVDVPGNPTNYTVEVKVLSWVLQRRKPNLLEWK
jgi:hypothetical protein